MKKMIIVSPETHSHLFLIKGRHQMETGKNITIDEIIKIILSHYDSIVEPFKLEEKE